jgi:hypothetical protein
LLALPREAFAALPARDRAIVQLYYGLTGEEPRSQDPVAAQLGLRQDLVGYVVRGVTGRLLGWRVLDPAGRLQVPCVMCGALIDRPKPQAHRAHTCSRAWQAGLDAAALRRLL